MTSIKQIEAFYWSGQLGSFVAAAERLNTTQSNISKRIQELEYAFGAQLFDRSKRASRLTPKAEELMRVSEDLLRLHARLRQIGKSSLAMEGPFSFGVTEAVALTWLPRLCALLRESFPGIVPVARVSSTPKLNQDLIERRIDLAIGTDGSLDPALITVPLIEVRRAWVASPKLVPHDRRLTANELQALPMLGHGTFGLPHNAIGKMLRRHGVDPNIVSSCNTLSVLAAMAVAGVGITYLHLDVFADEIRAGRLKVVDCDVEVPSLTYVAAYRDDLLSPMAERVAAKAVEACRFVDTVPA